jgi:pimeloyl-ACP methyl ester carboxylesterase
MRVSANGLELEYATFGRESDPPFVLITGFAQQLIVWDPSFCQQLASRGFHVVVFDNRDVGLSTKIESAPRPRMDAIFSGDRSTVAYGIHDMADDTAGLIEGLGFGAAHVVGVSMGGMIAQSLTIRHPARVKSLVSIMSTTGDRRVGGSTPEAQALVVSRAPTEREANIEHAVRSWHILRSPGYTYDESKGRARATASYDRCFYPQGVARQAAAILSQDDRTSALGSVKAPATVIHGDADPLIHMSGGEATARALPGARLIVVPGMGHDLPEGAWPLLIDAIVTNTTRSV